jgi:hypothetical protein
LVIFRSFFDNITTTATTRSPRMGVGCFKNQNPTKIQQNILRSAKENSYSNEYLNFYPKNAPGDGSISLNETKSSEESHGKKENDSFRMVERTNVRQTEEESDTPEWFSWPASRHDVIDLHGFEEDEVVEHQNKPDVKTEGEFLSKKI